MVHGSNDHATDLTAHERERTINLLRARMDQLLHNSIAWQETYNLYKTLKDHDPNFDPN
jgi:hypothetical protein